MMSFLSDAKKYISFFILIGLLCAVAPADLEAADNPSSSTKDDSLFMKGAALGACVGGLLGFGFAKLFSLKHSSPGSDGQGGAGGQAGGSSYQIQLKNPEKTFADVVMPQRAIDRVLAFMEMIANKKKYQTLGAKLSKALLLEGGDGYGKKLLAHAIANELQAKIAYIPFPQVSSLSEREFEEMFMSLKRASEKTPIMVLVDGLDALNKLADIASHSSIADSVKLDQLHSFEKLADAIDMLDENDNVFVVATTKNVADLDSILLSAECFGPSIVSIPLPDDAIRKKLMVYYLGKIKTDESFNAEACAEQLISKTAGFTGENIKQLVEQAVVVAGQHNCETVSAEHVAEACGIVKDILRQNQQFELSSHEGDKVNFVFSEKTKYADVIGADEALTEVRECVDFLKNPEKYTKLGAKMPKGILLEGPPGCGKTLIARAIAGEAGACFIQASGAGFVKMYVGTGPAAVRSIFNFAHNMAKQTPVVLFIDEIDAVGARTDEQHSGVSEYNNTINELLQQIDGFEQSDNILVVGATNYSERLDPALKRSGRLERQIKISLPTLQGRTDLFTFYLKKVAKLEDGLSIQQIAESFASRTPGFSGADVARLVNDAQTLAARYGVDAVGSVHFEEALDRMKLGLKNSFRPNAEDLKRTAYHESGHTLMAILKNQPVAKMSILSRGGTLGVMWQKMQYDESHSPTKNDLMNEIMIGLGGQLAEELVFGELSAGASGDLRMANAIAKRMVEHFGMGEGELQGVTLDGVNSDAMKQKFDSAAAQILQKALVQTRTLLKDNKGILVRLAEELLKKETLLESEIYAIAGRTPPARKL